MAQRIVSLYCTSMDSVRKAVELLYHTENSLRGLIQEATAGGDYEVVMRLTSWAQFIKALRGPSQPESLSPSEAPGQQNAAADSETAAKPLDDSEGHPVRKSARGGSNRSSYPKFYRQGDSLVKVGWSKRSKSEYVHKASRRVVELVAKAMSTVGADGRLLKAEAFLPTADPTDGNEIASYQGYLGLAWLRHEDLVHQHGRQGYTVGNSGAICELVAQRWESLEKKEQWRTSSPMGGMAS